MTISLLVPTRGRVDKLKRLLNSIKATATSDDYDIILGIDTDDDATMQAHQRREFGDARAFVGPPMQPFNLSAMFNRLARISRASHFWVLGDDCVIESSFWHEAIMTVPQGYYGNAASNFAYSEFPVLTLGALTSLGWLLPEHIPGWGADHFLLNVYSAAGLVVDLPVKIRHERELTGAEFRRMAAISGVYDPAAGVRECAETLKAQFGRRP